MGTTGTTPLWQQTSSVMSLEPRACFPTGDVGVGGWRGGHRSAYSRQFQSWENFANQAVRSHYLQGRTPQGWGSQLGLLTS